jgi:hypothetical protein
MQPQCNGAQERLKNLMEISPSHDQGVLEGLPPMTSVFKIAMSEDVTHLHIAVDPSAGKDCNM